MKGKENVSPPPSNPAVPKKLFSIFSQAKKGKTRECPVSPAVSPPRPEPAESVEPPVILSPVTSPNASPRAQNGQKPSKGM